MAVGNSSTACITFYMPWKGVTSTESALSPLHTYISPYIISAVLAPSAEFRKLEWGKKKKSAWRLCCAAPYSLLQMKLGPGELPLRGTTHYSPLPPPQAEVTLDIWGKYMHLTALKPFINRFLFIKSIYIKYDTLLKTAYVQLKKS